MPTTENKKKVFPYYSHVPAEIRMMIIDDMHPDDRCRFTRCSQSSYKEAKSSKKFIHGLKINIVLDSIWITVIQGCAKHYGTDRGFILAFSYDENGKKMVRCLNIERKQLWEMPIYTSRDLIPYAIQHFKDILHFYCNTVKQLELDKQVFCRELNNFDLGITSLNNLEDVTAGREILVSQILPVLQRPLKELASLTEGWNCVLPLDREIYQVQDRLDLPNTKLTNEQFLKLSASNIILNIGEMTVEDVYNFINAWQNGEVRETFRSCKWELTTSRFNQKQLFRIFGVTLSVNWLASVEVKHHNDPEIIARLSTGWERHTLYVRFATKIDR